MDVSRKDPKTELPEAEPAGHAAEPRPDPDASSAIGAADPASGTERPTQNAASPKGLQLIETVITLTGLPESLAHQELDHILEMSGRGPGTRTDLTLDQLREALLSYLEALQPTSVD